MGRSVSTHRHAVATVYLNPEIEDDGDSFAWDSFVEDLQQNVIADRFPSFSECDRWMDREDHVIMENAHAEVSVSEYCGLVAVCLAPRDPDDAFAVAWTENFASSFHAHVTKMFKSSALTKVGTFSNGESVFEKI